jgi:hypothetical protein
MSANRLRRDLQCTLGWIAALFIDILLSMPVTRESAECYFSATLVDKPDRISVVPSMNLSKVPLGNDLRSSQVDSFERPCVCGREADGTVGILENELVCESGHRRAEPHLVPLIEHIRVGGIMRAERRQRVTWE